MCNQYRDVEAAQDRFREQRQIDQAAAGTKTGRFSAQNPNYSNLPSWLANNERGRWQYISRMPISRFYLGEPVRIINHHSAFHGAEGTLRYIFEDKHGVQMGRGDGNNLGIVEYERQDLLVHVRAHNMWPQYQIFPTMDQWEYLMKGDDMDNQDMDHSPVDRGNEDEVHVKMEIDGEEDRWEVKEVIYKNVPYIQPLGPRVLVERLTVEERQTDSGLVIPERGAPPSYKSQIIAVGDGLTKEVKVGDVVLTTQHVGDEVRLNQVAHWLVHEDDLLAVIR